MDDKPLFARVAASIGSGAWLRIWQTLILLKKNGILYWRRWKSTLVQVLAPFAIVALLWGLSKLAETNIPESFITPLSFPSGPIPACKTWNDDDPCYAFIYGVNEDLPSSFSDIIESAITQIKEDEPNVNDDNVRRMGSYNEIYQFSIDSPNRTMASLYFDEMENNGVRVINYTLLFNSTSTDMPDIVPSMTAAVESALLRVTAQDVNGDAQTRLEVLRKGFPVPPSEVDGEVIIFSVAGPLFFSFALQLILVVSMYSVVVEKENKLRFGMKMMGLKDISYWTSWLLTCMAIAFASTLVTIISGYIFQIHFFLNCNFFVLVAIFLTFGLSLVSLAFALSTLVSTVRAALILGFVILGISFLLNIFLANGFLVYLLYSEDVNPGWRRGFAFYPPYNFAKAFADILFKTLPEYNPITREYESGPGYSFTDFWRENVARGVRAPPTADSMYLLLMNSAIFWVLTWYLDSVLPSGGAGVSRGFLFFIYPSYWGIKIGRKTIANAIEHVEEKKPSDEEDEDLLRESERARDVGTILDDGSDSLALRIVGLQKNFDALRFPLKKSKDAAESTGNAFKDMIFDRFQAVRGLDLAVNPGTCIALLGHNGAGKTTTISMLVGLIPPSGGEAFIYSNSIRSDVDEIRRSLGVCPQHDILWDDLTAREHLTLFCEFKGIPWSKINDEVDQRLKDVALYAVGKKCAGTYSGGMKRRLSVAISCIGDPSMILLDEPTTGMDPHSKRQVWELIHNMKGNRVILLTTHSMEEADALSDRIAIMAHGKLRCVGDSLHLKHKYGAGYNIKLVGNTNATNSAEVMRTMEKTVHEYIPNATLVSENAGNMIFNVPPENVADLGRLVEHIESEVDQEGSLIRDWGLSHTSLEEVYLKVTSKANFGFTSRKKDDVEMETRTSAPLEGETVESIEQ